ncbi:DUF1071 domain-containing protein [Priestia megaterium]
MEAIQFKPKEEVKENVVEELQPVGNYFADLADINVNDVLDKKNGFSYLSWAHAVDILKRKHPDAKIVVKRFPEPESPGILVPYYRTKVGYYVEVDVIVNGVSVCEPFPVTNYQNKPIAQPTSSDINNSIQRAKVKMIAGHGLGLYIYAGEDVPKATDDEPQQPKGPNQASSFVQQPNNQGSYQNQNQNQNQNNNQQPAVMSQNQQDQMRNLATQIAALTVGEGASQDMLIEQVKAVYNNHQITANMSFDVANMKINALTNELNSIHTNRMKNNTTQALGGMFNNAQ